MNDAVFVKTYRDRAQAAAARAHLDWLEGLGSDVRLPAVRPSGPRRLVFEHLGHRRPDHNDLAMLAHALGALHAAAYTQQLYAARLDEPFTAPGGLVIADFIAPRQQTLDRLPLPVDGLPVAFYKDANIRNFLLTDDGVAVVDFDDLTLAPFGYDLAKLIVSTAMTFGRLNPRAVEQALTVYNTRTLAAGERTPCSPAQLRAYTEVHHLLTARYLRRNGYRHSWPDVRPWPTPSEVS